MKKIIKNSLSCLLFCPLLMSSYTVQAEQGFRDRASTTRLANVNELESDIDAEIAFGREIASRILGKYKLSTDKKLNKYLNIIGRGIASFSSRPELVYHFALLDTDDINAYTAPGGYVFVTRGALNLMQDEAELAAVLAHEIAHVTQKHIVNELDIKASEDGMQEGMMHFLGGSSDPSRVAFSQAVDQAVGFLFNKGLKKEDEFEADRVGMLLASITGYDSRALHRYLERVKQAKGEHTATVSTTHPSFDTRLSTLHKINQEEELDALQGKLVKQRFTYYVASKSK